jgi:hypothetical protein
MAIVKLLGARLSFPDLFTAVQFEGAGPFSYRAAFLQAEDQPVMIQQADKSWKKTTMRKVIEDVASEAWKAATTAASRNTTATKATSCCPLRAARTRVVR